MANYYCEYCGTVASSISHLTAGVCTRHPNGPNKGKHSLYQGSEKSQYNCKYCGTRSSTIFILTGGVCNRHPSGPNKGKHAPAL